MSISGPENNNNQAMHIYLSYILLCIVAKFAYYSGHINKEAYSYYQCLRHYLIYVSHPTTSVFLVHVLLNFSKGEACLR